MSSSTSSHTILITVKQAGLDQVNTAVKGFAATANTATKSTTALGGAFSKADSSSTKYSKTVTALGKGYTTVNKAVGTTTKSTNTYTTSTGKASTATDKLSKGIGAGGRGLAFGFIGLGSAVAEAAGMYGMYADAASKVEDAQQRVNELTTQGVTSGAAYTRATNDLADAQRGLNFILRNTVLSFTDIATFVLLAVNALANMRTISQSAATSTQALTTATEALNIAQGVTSTAVQAAGSAYGELNNALSNASVGTTTFVDSLGRGTVELGNTSTAVLELDTTVRNMGTAFTDGVTAVDGLYTSSGQLLTGVTDLATETENYIPILSGSGNQSLLGGITAVDDIMIKNDKTVKAHRLSLVGLAQGVKALPAAFVSAGQAIAGFFTNFGANMTKMGGWLKTAGLAVLDFGKKMLLAFITNPIGLAIVGITAAIVALATNFLGFRDAVNGVGVALGNAVPALKGVLDWLGQMGNSALDFIAGLVGIETEAKKHTQTMSAMTKVYQEFSDKLDHFIEYDAPFAALITDANYLGTEMVRLKGGIDVVSNSWTTYIENQLKPIMNLHPELGKQIDEITASTLEEAKGMTDVDQIVSLLIQSVGKYFDVIFEGTGFLSKYTAAQEEEARIAKESIGLTSEQASALSLINKALGETETALGSKQQAQEADAQAVAGWLTDMELATKVTDLQKVALMDFAGVLNETGNYLDLNAGKVTTLTDVLVAMTAQEQKVGEVGNQVWQYMETLLLRLGEDALPLVQNGIDYIRTKNEALADVIQTLFDDWMSGMVVVEGKIWLVNEAEAQQAEKVDESRQKIDEKAKSLNALDQIQGASNETATEYLGLLEDSNKEMTDSTETLRQLAVSRGMDTKAIGASNETLRNYIQTHEEEININELVANGIVIMTAEREHDAQMTEVERQVNEAYVQSLNDTIDTTGMTAAGLADLAQVLEDTSNAQQIVTDDLKLWRAEMERNVTVEETAIKSLEAFAESIGVQIPESIRSKGVPAVKQLLEEIIGFATGTVKSMEMVNEAVQEGIDSLASSFSSIGQQAADAFQEGEDEFEDFLDKTGLDPDNPLVLQGIVEMMMNDTNFEDDFTQFTEYLAANIQSLNGATAADLTAMVYDWNSIIADELEDNPEAVAAIQAQSQAIIDTMNRIMSTGNVTGVEAFMAAIEQVLGKTEAVKLMETLGIQIPATLADKIEAGQQVAFNVASQMALGIVDASVGGLESGQGRMATAGEKHTLAMLEPFGPAAQEAFKLAQGISDKAVEGVKSGEGRMATAGELHTLAMLEPFGPAAQEAFKLAQGITDQTAQGLESGKSVVQNATLVSVYDPITNTIKQVPAGAAEGLVPIEGVFSTAFMKASVASTGIINLLFADITKSMGYFVQNVGIALDTIAVMFQANSTVWTAWGEGITTALVALSELIVAFVQESFVPNIVLMDTTLQANMTVWIAWGEGITTSLVALSELWVSFINETMIANIDALNIAINDSYVTYWVPYFTSLTDALVAFSELWVTFIDETLIANFVKLQDEILRNWTEGWLVWTTNIGESLVLIGDGIDQFYNDVFEPFNTGTIKGLEEQKDAWVEWAEKAGGALVLIGNGIDQFYNNVFEPFSTGFVTAMDEMSSKVESFAEACVAAFAKVAQSADDARTSVENLQSAIDALKDKTVTITTVYKTVGKPARFGGSIIGYARAGDSWIQDRPTTLGGMRVSEGSKPELITATPLSNPYDMSDKKINIPTPNLQIPNAAGGLGGGGGGQPITVTGDIYLTVKTQSGETLANEVKPYLLRGFSGIT